MTDDLTPLVPDDISTDDDSSALPDHHKNDETVFSLDSPKVMAKYLRRVISHAKPRTREKLAKFLWETARGTLCDKAMHLANLPWSRFVILRSQHRELIDIYRVCRDTGEELRHMQREAEAHRRAHEGVRTPVYYKGNRVGMVRKYSDKLMEILLNAGDPDKYADRSKSESEHKEISFVFHFDQKAAEKDLEAHRAKKAKQGLNESGDPQDVVD